MRMRPLIAAGTTLGIGMGGFVDGILFHQILQLHGMLSARLKRTTLVNVEINMFWDGLFHAFTWGMTALGLALLWRAARDRDVPLSTRAFVGSLLAGAGVFNLVEGLIDHQILQIHHVVDSANPLPWDLAFLASGAALIVAGGMLVRSAAGAPAGAAR